MIDFPDRISGLIQRLERGEIVTQQQVDDVATLQSLDLAKIGEDFARESIRIDSQLSDELAKGL